MFSKLLITVTKKSTNVGLAISLKNSLSDLDKVVSRSPSIIIDAVIWDCLSAPPLIIAYKVSNANLFFTSVVYPSKQLL